MASPPFRMMPQLAWGTAQIAKSKLSFGALLYLTMITNFAIVLDQSWCAVISDMAEKNNDATRLDRYQITSHHNRTNKALPMFTRSYGGDFNINNLNNVCQNNQVENLFVLITVHSACQNRPQRDAIRNTWGRSNDMPGHIRLLFILGVCFNELTNMKIKHEATLYRDILQLDIAENYRNLSLKSVNALQWVLNKCEDVDFIFKCDDDSYINVESVLDYIRNSSKYESFIHGHVYTKPRVMRSGLWGVSSQVYAEERYPDYCSGNNYVISSGVARRIVTCHGRQGGPIIHLEDVYITGLLSICAKTKLKHDARFPNWMTGPGLSTLRALVQGSLFGLHGVDYGRMYPIYKMMNICRNCGRNDWELRKWFKLIKECDFS